MGSPEYPMLFKETRLSLDPAAASSIANIAIPVPPGSTRSNQRNNEDHVTTEHEAVFRRKNLASAASIFYRSGNQYPKGFLWRVLEDGGVVSVRAVDSHLDRNTQDAPLVLNLHFPVPILPSCVALSSSTEHDSVYIQAIDQSNNLYTITLRSDYFRKRSSLEGAMANACKIHQPAALGFRHPHRLYAANPDILLVALHDGGLIKLERAKAGSPSGQAWKETLYNSQGWAQGIRNMLPFHGNTTIKHGKFSLEYTVTTSAQVTSLGLDDQQFLVTVCLDHRMRIWSLMSGQIVFTGDILNKERNPQDSAKYAIDPSQSNLVYIIGSEPGRRLCVTYSPIGAGEFKFWHIQARDGNRITVEDGHPNLDLIPKAPSSSDVWTLADFALTQPPNGVLQLWTMWKNNMTYRVQQLEIDLDRIQHHWETDWRAVQTHSGASTVQTSGPCEPTDVTDKWLQKILTPGRFTKATLDTALSIYERGRGKARDGGGGEGGGGGGGNRSRKSLPESICSVIASTASLDRRASGGMDYEQFRGMSEIQWRRFYRLLLELDKQRGEALSLAIDQQSSMAWIVCADALGAIRAGSELEIACSAPTDAAGNAASVLISAGLSFLDGFSDNMWHLCNSVLRSDLYEDPSKTDFERLQHFNDKTGFWRGITDEDCSQVAETLGQGFGLANADSYHQFFNLMECSVEGKERPVSRPFTDLGRKLIVNSVQEIMDLQWKVCFGQLVLLVHMEFEAENEEDALHNSLDVSLIFRRLVRVLRRLELVKWLAMTEIVVGSMSTGRSRSSSLTQASPRTTKKAQDSQTITALEAYVGHLMGFMAGGETKAASSFTTLAQDLCASDSNIIISPTLIQCFLIRSERADLAAELAPLCDHDPFSTYVKGRVSLALKDFDAAALSMRQAAHGMGLESDRSKRPMSSNLLDETEKNLLYNGMAKYYSHIVALFEKARGHSYVVDFCRLALQFIPSKSRESAVLKTEILGRMFNAAIVTSLFEMAHTSLQSMTDTAMRQSCLRKLVDRMCETGHSAEMLALPLGRLQPAVDDLLEQRCRSQGDVIRGTPYHQILYAWRVRYGNYRGAASTLLDRINKLRRAGEADNLLGEDGFDTPVTKLYLLLINALSCVDPSEAWILSEVPVTDAEGGGSNINGKDISGTNIPRMKRKVVTLADVRREYQDELDRISAIQNNQFGLDAGDAMDIL